MFLLHPRVAERLNTKTQYSTFSTEGLAGPVGRTLHAQQANRLLAFGHHCLASTGGTASLCGGAAGPGGGLAGASGSPFSGSTWVAAGGSNGAGGGVPIGGQEIGRYSIANGQFGNYLVDDATEVEPMDAGGGSLLGARFVGGAIAAAFALASGLASIDGLINNDMTHLAGFKGVKKPFRKVCSDCPKPNNTNHKGA